MQTFGTWLIILHLCVPPPSSADYSCALTVLLSAPVNAKHVWHTHNYKNTAYPLTNDRIKQHIRTISKQLNTTPKFLMYVSIPPHTPNHTSHCRDTPKHIQLFLQNPLLANISKQTITYASHNNTWHLSALHQENTLIQEHKYLDLKSFKLMWIYF